MQNQNQSKPPILKPAKFRNQIAPTPNLYVNEVILEEMNEES